MKDGTERSSVRPKECVKISKNAMIYLLVSGAVLGLFLDSVHSQFWSDRDCYVWGFSVGFTFYGVVAIAFLILIAYLLAFLGVGRRWFGFLLIFFSIPIGNLSMFLTYGGLARRCYLASEFGMIFVFSIPIATLLGVSFAVAVIICSKKVPREQSIFGRKRIVHITYILIALLGLIITCFPGLEIRPRITGTVVDDEDMRPIENVWITASIGRPRGGVSIGPPHIRTDEKGGFELPMRASWGAAAPFKLWKKDEPLYAYADSPDDKRGSSRLDNYDWEIRANMIILVRPWREGLNNEKEYFAYLNSLSNYCHWG